MEFRTGICPRCHQLVQLPAGLDRAFCPECGSALRVDEALQLLVEHPELAAEDRDGLAAKARFASENEVAGAGDQAASEAAGAPGAAGDPAAPEAPGVAGDPAAPEAPIAPVVLTDPASANTPDPTSANTPNAPDGPDGPRAPQEPQTLGGVFASIFGKDSVLQKERHTPFLDSWHTDGVFTFFGVLGRALVMLTLINMFGGYAIDSTTGLPMVSAGANMAGAVFEVIVAWMALRMVPRRFAKGYEGTDHMVSFWNGFVGGLIFGLYWNNRLTKRRLGWSHLLFFLFMGTDGFSTMLMLALG